jgi:site-specific recombinase XerD
VRLKHLSQSGVFPSGNPRFYYRPKGRKGLALPDLPADHPKFLAAYAAASGAKDLPDPPVLTGTIAAAVVAFLRSDAYHAAAPNTRRVWYRGLQRIRESYGRGRLADLAAQHIRADLARLKPNPAVQRLKIWRAMLGWAEQVGMIEADPTTTVKRPKAPKGAGHAAWTADDVAAFRAHWPIGTAQRLAFEIFHWTGASAVDAAKLSETMISNGWLEFARQKSGSMAAMTWAGTPAPAWAGSPDHLASALAARNVRHLVFLTTAKGAPRSANSISQWFTKAAKAAGVTRGDHGKGAHGLRIYRARAMREAGATGEQRAAWLGHDSVAQTEAYSKGADLRALIMGPDGEHKSSNFSQSSNSPEKAPTKTAR